jgi:hypothetical protein
MRQGAAVGEMREFGGIWIRHRYEVTAEFALPIELQKAAVLDIEGSRLSSP